MDHLPIRPNLSMPVHFKTLDTKIVSGGSGFGRWRLGGLGDGGWAMSAWGLGWWWGLGGLGDGGLGGGGIFEESFIGFGDGQTINV